MTSFVVTELQHNDRAVRADTVNLPVDEADVATAARAITRWPGYQPTPLVSLAGLARAIGIEAILYKDEGSRFGLGSFKAMGGAYAVSRLLSRIIAERTGRSDDLSFDELVSGDYRDIAQSVTVCCATDGNHGRAVAWGAQLFGCNCTIFLHPHVSEGREKAIAAYGAKIVRTPGNYDDSVRAAAEAAEANGWHVVSDTSWEGYTEIPRNVMLGYTVLVDEALQQLPEGKAPTHVLVQGGVGGLAGAVAAMMVLRYGAARPRFIVVEPDRADCLLQSARAGEPVTVHGDLDTIMAGLACGEPSALAWSILDSSADDFASIPDSAIAPAMRLLAASPHGDPAIVAGESAVAGLSLLMAAAADSHIADALGINAASRVLLIGTERDTDPELYQRLVRDRTP